MTTQVLTKLWLKVTIVSILLAMIAVILTDKDIAPGAGITMSAVHAVFLVEWIRLKKKEELTHQTTP